MEHDPTITQVGKDLEGQLAQPPGQSRLRNISEVQFVVYMAV